MDRGDSQSLDAVILNRAGYCPTEDISNSYREFCLSQQMEYGERWGGVCYKNLEGNGQGCY